MSVDYSAKWCRILSFHPHSRLILTKTRPISFRKNITSWLAPPSPIWIIRTGRILRYLIHIVGSILLVLLHKPSLHMITEATSIMVSDRLARAQKAHINLSEPAVIVASVNRFVNFFFHFEKHRNLIRTFMTFTFKLAVCLPANWCHYFDIDSATRNEDWKRSSSPELSGQKLEFFNSLSSITKVFSSSFPLDVNYTARGRMRRSVQATAGSEKLVLLWFRLIDGGKLVTSFGGDNLIYIPSFRPAVPFYCWKLGTSDSMFLPMTWSKPNLEFFLRSGNTPLPPLIPPEYTLRLNWRLRENSQD